MFLIAIYLPLLPLLPQPLLQRQCLLPQAPKPLPLLLRKNQKSAGTRGKNARVLDDRIPGVKKDQPRENVPSAIAKANFAKNAKNEALFGPKSFLRHISIVLTS